MRSKKGVTFKSGTSRDTYDFILLEADTLAGLPTPSLTLK
jgi:hypothetical protein